jgi:hypothetical protein
LKPKYFYHIGNVLRTGIDRHSGFAVRPWRRRVKTRRYHPQQKKVSGLSSHGNRLQSFASFAIISFIKGQPALPVKS